MPFIAVLAILILFVVYLYMQSTEVLEPLVPKREVVTEENGMDVKIAMGLTAEQIEEQKKNEERLMRGCIGGKDCIPSIDNPKFISPDEVTFLDDEDFVIGLEYEGVARAYPIKIMNMHEIVNDTIQEKPIAITFCPLCYTGIAFERVLDGEPVELGVSGYLLNNNLVLYDRKTDTLWSQLDGEALVGPKFGQKLKRITVATVWWKEWLEKYPDTEVLSTDTGFIRDYDFFPYGDYNTNPRVMFPIEFEDDRLPRKELVFGIEIDGKAKAYPKFELEKVLPDGGELEDELAGNKLTVSYDNGAFTVHEKASGEEIVPQISFYFSWVAFFPETEIYQP